MAVKFENIMFENSMPESEIKVIDFGLSKKFLPSERVRTMSEGVGTVNYCRYANYDIFLLIISLLFFADIHNGTPSVAGRLHIPSRSVVGRCHYVHAPVLAETILPQETV